MTTLKRRSGGLRYMRSSARRTSAKISTTSVDANDRRSLERVRNIRIEGPQGAEQMARLKALAAAGTSGGAHFWAQIAHAGRQAASAVCPGPVAPSAVAIESAAWKKGDVPKELGQDEIHNLIGRCVSCVDAPLDASVFSLGSGMWSGAFVCPAS